MWNTLKSRARVAALPIVALVFAVMAIQCHPESSFKCGFKRPDGSIQSCAGAHEVCICATNSCARRDFGQPPGGGSCPSGFRYLSSDYVDEADANVEAESCVSTSLVEWRLTESQAGERCSDEPNGPSLPGSSSSGGGAHSTGATTDTSSADSTTSDGSSSSSDATGTTSSESSASSASTGTGP